jgi:Spy/CpxP family protein refolding chaperone
MKVTKTSIAVIAVTGLLALTSAVRAQTNTSTNAAPPAPKMHKAGPPVEVQLERLTRELTLTDAEKPLVKAVLEDQNKQMEGLSGLSPEDRRTKMQAIREEVSTKMKGILTPEQYTKYQALPPMGPRSKKGGNPPGGTPPAGTPPAATPPAGGQ